jgi:hypothetical protein
MIDCSMVSAGTNVSLVQSCDIVRSGALRMLTPFRYPNGEQIDLFLEEPQPLLGGFVLSDLGQTTSYLLDLQVKPWASNKRRQIIEDVCRSLEVQWRGGRFQIEIANDDVGQLSPFMMRLAQACIRVSDLSFSARIWSAGSFRDELEEYLHSIDLRYEPNPVEIGTKAQEVKLDFRVFGESSQSLVQSMSSASASSAHSISLEVFSRWFDLGQEKRGGPKHVTVIDESNDVFKDTDIGRLDRLSSVFWFPADQDQLTESLSR